MSSPPAEQQDGNNNSSDEVATLEQSASEAVQTLTRLDDEYVKLQETEQNLLDLMDCLVKEEACLNEALRECSETGAERRAREVQERDQAVISRLQSALMADSSSDEQSSGDESSEAKNTG